MPEVQSYTLNLENKGVLISRPGDVIPPEFLTASLNITANKTGFIESRAGTARVSSTQLPGPVSSQGRIIINGVPFIYQGATTGLYRAFSLISTGFSGNPLVMRDGGPDLAILPNILVFDSNQRIKDNGTLTTNFGIAGPLISAVVTAPVSALSKIIDNFEYATNVALNAVWATTTGTLTTSAVAPQSGTYSANDAFAAGASTYITASITVDLSQFAAPGDSTDQDFISFYIRTDTLGKLFAVVIQFDVDATTNDFAHNYYTKWYDSSSMPASTGVWTQLQCRKSEFTRSGGSANGWANVKKIRFQIVGIAGAGAWNLGVDSLQMLSGASLPVTGYDWIYRYRNSTTQSTSPFSPLMLAATTVLGGSAIVTVVNPRDTQVDTLELYRRGGDNSIFLFVTSAAVTAWTGTADIVDNFPDSSLGDTTDLDQVEMANLLETSSAVVKSFIRTDNSGGTWTDYTAAVSDNTPGTYAVLSALTPPGGLVLISADGPFRQILLSLDSNVNTNIATLQVQFWNGTSWVDVANLVDGTSVGGKTLAQSGTVTFDFPSDMGLMTWLGVTGYFFNLHTSSALSATVHVTEARIGANAFNPTIGEVFGGRVWMDDSNHTDRVWYSERFAVEIFLENNYIVGSTSGDPIVRPYGLDDQLFIFTQKSVDRLIGSSPGSFQPIATGSEMGLFSKYAICKGQGKIYYRGYDGIYALPGSGFSQKLTLAIDPIFHGIAGGTEAELQPIDKDYAGTETMEFFDMKLRFGYTATNGHRYEIVYDLETDRYEMTDRETTSYLRLDDEGLIYSGNSDGYVYQLESGNDDQGTDITLRFRTAYFDFGVPSQTKQLTEIVIDADLAGETLDFYADMDNGEGTTQHVAVTNTVRGPLFFPLTDDTQARNIALRLDSDNGGSLVKFFKITFFYIVLPTPLSVLPTDWDSLGYAGDKRFNQLQIEIDTQSIDVTVDVQVDSVTVQTLTVNTDARKVVPFSIVADTIGKLVRLIFRGIGGFRYYRHEFSVDKDPLQMTRYDTYWLDFGYTRWKFIRRIWLSVNTPAIVTIEVQIDEVSRFTTTLIVDAGTGWKKVMLKMPPGLKGMLFRFIMTTDSGEKIYLDQSDVEWHPLANERGYDRAKLIQSDR